ncbi:helix-turn-helix transcriptional regulator [Nocardia vaccinii]|uniref:helix-turn-helix transcriptional regulator n=1 Tax=Nocardia vaccinii TaxID=1822 RepID=UPI00082DA37E|nr:LuxR family transcriptional regulator [Nocardia vaccinii]
MVRNWPLTGRGEDLAWTEAACRQLRGNGGAVLAGSAGVGKTRLAREIATRIRRRGVALCWAAATESARAVPLGAFSGLVGDPGPEHNIVRHAIGCLTADAGSAGTVVIVDDAHLLDDVSALVVQQLVVQRAATVLLTVRTGEPAPDAISALWKDEQLPRRELRPLSSDETGELLDTVLGGLVETRTQRRLWDLTRGNMLFLRQLVDGGRFRAEGGVTRLAEQQPLPATLAETVVVRLAELAPEIVEVVDLLALGEPLHVDGLAELTAPGVIEGAEAAGLVEVDPARLTARLAHPLYGEARRAVMGTMRARRLRGRIVRVLDDDTDLLRRGFLMVDSDLEPDVELLLHAGAEAVRLGDFRGGQLGRAALTAGGGFEAQLLVASGAAWVDPAHAEHELEVLCGLAADEEQLIRAVLMQATYLHWTCARPADAQAVLDEARPRLPESLRQCLDGMSAVFHSQRGRIAAAFATATAILAESRSDAAMLTAEFALVTATAAAGRIHDGGEPFQLALAIAGRVPDLAYLANPMVAVRILGLVWAGCVDEAEAMAQQLDQALLGIPFVSHISSCLLGEIALARGDLPIARRRLQEAQIGLAPYGYGGGWRFVALTALVQVQALVGEPTIESRAALAAIRSESTGVMDPIAELAEAWASAALGGVSVAARMARDAAELARGRGQDAHVVMALHTVVRLGDASVAADLTELAAHVQGPRAAAVAAHAAALAESDADALLQAADLLEKMGDRPAAMDAAAQAAQCYARDGRTGSAKWAGHRAHRLAGTCPGITTPALSRADRPLSLSEREREVVTMAAHGASNSEIAVRLGIDRRTVEGHLYRAGNKLGTGNRADFARILGIEHTP